MKKAGQYKNMQLAWTKELRAAYWEEDEPFVFRDCVLGEVEQNSPNCAAARGMPQQTTERREAPLNGASSGKASYRRCTIDCRLPATSFFVLSSVKRSRVKRSQNGLLLEVENSFASSCFGSNAPDPRERLEQHEKYASISNSLDRATNERPI